MIHHFSNMLGQLCKPPYPLFVPMDGANFVLPLSPAGESRMIINFKQALNIWQSYYVSCSAYILLSQSLWHYFRSFLLSGFYLLPLPRCVPYPPSSFTQYNCAWCSQSYKLPIAAPILASFSPVGTVEVFLLHPRTIPLLVLLFPYPPNFPRILHYWLYFFMLLLFRVNLTFQLVFLISHQLLHVFSLSHYKKEGKKKGRKEWKMEGEKNSPLTLHSVLVSASSLWPKVSHFHFLISHS